MEALAENRFGGSFRKLKKLKEVPVI